MRDLGLRDAKDTEIFQAARQAGAVVMTKDSDFAMLLERFGPPAADLVGDVWQHFQCTSYEDSGHEFVPGATASGPGRTDRGDN